ncbi:MAG: hypothetical protein C0173_08420 [Desulfurella sp.]|uniref:hypothetical protein n=1 Tax=Desulfurella sp. TaxID=1962857 RepID=UPI000CB9A430|nr:hypothetical protein [Desulfurella sp.]PMP87693.1 MAG: hypothetical protein C0173_08420 [Desulfurella sp.]
MISENGIIVKKTGSQNINFINIITPKGKIDAIVYGKKQLSLLYLFNFELKESNNIYIVSKFYLIDRFEFLNTKEKLMAAFFIIDVANQIDVDYDFLVETIKLLDQNDIKYCIDSFLVRILTQNGIYKKEFSNTKDLILELEKYLGKKLKVSLDEVFIATR